jgi:hypothetical protein
VVGVSRSGTTLLRLMLDAHPQLAVPAESRFLPELIERIAAGADRAAAAGFVTGSERWDDFGLDAEAFRARVEALPEFGAGQVARAFFGLYAEGQGKPRWGDKSPPYVVSMPAIHGALPEARFVHLIRDGRDVAASLMARDWGARRPRRIARRWTSEVQAGRQAAATLGPALCLEVRYERLVEDPEGVLRDICSHVELDYDPAMLAYHERADQRLAELGDLEARTAAERATQFERVHSPLSGERIGAWRRELGAADRAAFEAVAGELLVELGYPTQ